MSASMPAESHSDPRVVKVLYVWTEGDSQTGEGGETAKVTAPGWLLSEADTDPTGFEQRLITFKEKVIEAFAALWGQMPRASFDFELEREDA